MTTLHRSPGPPLSREEIANIEVGHTTVTPLTARLLVGTFLVLVIVSAALDITTPWSRDPSSADGPWSQLTALPARVVQQWSRPAGAIEPVGGWARLVAANRTTIAGFESFEESLETETRLAQALRPLTQHALTGWLGVGNERVYPGREGWLYYRPDLEHLTGPGFLSSRHVRQRLESAPDPAHPPQLDPHAAIVDLKRQLDARGIALVVMPTPVKPTVHPDGFSGAYDGWTTPLQNASYHSFLADLRRDGVVVFDPAALLVEARRHGSDQYLMNDTHWRPDAMRRVATALAEFVQSVGRLPAAADPAYRVETQRVSHLGDTAVMLDLPAHQRLYPPESVEITKVLQADGSPWRPSRTADVLVLGDSFSNIYSLASLGWGESAGLVEHLSHALRRPVDRVVQNDDGAFATRAALRRQLAGGIDRLAGKRVVVYQFATRELSNGDWKLIDLAVGATP